MSLINKLLAWVLFWLLALTPIARADITIIPSIPYQLQNGTTADASQVMADFNAIVNYVNTNAGANGSNSSITALNGLLAPPAGAGSLWFFGISADVGGTANAITITGTYPGGWSLLNAGSCMWFKPVLTNTGPATLNINSTGVVALKRSSVAGIIALQGGELVPTSPSQVCYDGVQYVLQAPQDVLEWPIPYANLASAATTSISSAACPNFKCTITGIQTITSFGTNATAGQIFYLQFTGGSTLTYNAASLILPGAVNILTNPQDTAAALYLGGGNWQVLFYTAAIQQFNNIGGLTPQANGLQIFNDGTNPSTTIDVTAQSALIVNQTYTASLACTNVNLSINTNTAGSSSGNDLDTGSRSSGTWYYVYIISNGTVCAGLASASSTSPTLPTGYGYFMRIGAFPTDGSGNFYRIRQAGVTAQYVVTPSTNTPSYPVLANGNLSAYSSIQVTGGGKLAPPTAGQVMVILQNYSGSSAQWVQVAPNSSYSSQNTTTAPPPCGITAYYTNLQCSLVLESNSIYGYSNAGSATLITGRGWVDQVAAN